MKVSMINEAGETKEIKVGISWTAFFFAGFPYFFRGIAVQGVIWIIVAMLTAGLSNLFLMFIINKKTAHYYLEDGYKPTGDGWDIAGEKWDIPVK